MPELEIKVRPSGVPALTSYESTASFAQVGAWAPEEDRSDALWSLVALPVAQLCTYNLLAMDFENGSISAHTIQAYHHV